MKIERLAIILLLVLFLFGFTDTIDTSLPTGQDDPREADDNMRRIQAGFVEILDLDHDFDLTGTELTGTGYHKSPLDVRAFGAVSGGADVSAEFELAIDEAISTGKPVYVPAGVWAVPTISKAITTPIVIIGDGMGASVIDGEDTASAFLTLTAVGSTFKDIAFSGFTGSVISITMSDDVEELFVDRCSFSSGGRGISATNVAKTLSDVSITNSLFKDLTKNGIKVSSFSEDVDVSSNIFDTIGTATSDEGVAIQFFHTTVGGDYSQTSRITVTNNKISNVDAVSGGEAHGIFMRGSYITISDNHIDGVGAGTNHEGIYTKAHQSEVSHNTVTSVGTSATCIMMKGGFAQDNIVESNICTPIDGGAGISINVGCTVSDNTVIGAAIIIAASDEGNPRYTYVVNDNYVESTGICLGVRDAIAANITGNLLISTGDDCITFSNNESASPHFGYALQDTVISGNTLITTGSNKRGIDGSAKILNTTITGNNITSTGFPISFTVTGSTASVHGNTWNGSAIAVIPAGQTTPNVSEWGTNVFQTANVGAVSITRLDTGFGGKPFTVIGTDGGNTTFVDTANSIALAGGANLTLGDSDTLNLVFLSYQGVHDGGDDAALLTDGGAVFPVDGFIGKIVVNMTDKSSVTITDNDGTTVTGTLAGGADNDWDDDDIYIIGYQWVEVSRSNN